MAVFPTMTISEISAGVIPACPVTLASRLPIPSVMAVLSVVRPPSVDTA